MSITRRCLLLTGIACSVAVGARAQEELFSRHVRVLRPQGPFTRLLIRATPGSGAGWKDVDHLAQGYRLRLPPGVSADLEPSGTRTLEAVFSDTAARPRPVLRVDVFKPEEDEATSVDLGYLAELIEEYPKQAFDGRFAVTDSALLVINRQSYAMIGGTYTQGAARAYRLQVTRLDRDRQVYVTFDCAENDWQRFSEPVARLLLTLEAPREKSRGKQGE